MNEFLKPVPVATLLIGLGLLLFGQIPLAVVCFVAWIASLAIGQMRQGAVIRGSDTDELLDADGRSRFTRVRNLTREIEELVEKHSASPVIRTLGRDAVGEAQRIRDQVADALMRRSGLRKAIAGRSVAEMEIAKLTDRRDGASSEEEKTSLSSALEARQMEVGHYAAAEQALERIDSGVRQAEAALSEMKARLEVGVTSQQAQVSEPLEDIRDTIGRMKAISVSYEEADAVLRDEI